MLVLSRPRAFIGTGGLAWPQTQVIGTIGEASTTPGRKLSTLPRSAALARLPKVTWIAPDSTATELTTLLTMLAAGGRPAAALSTGIVASVAHETWIGGLANSISLAASTTWSRMILSEM